MVDLLGYAISNPTSVVWFAVAVFVLSYIRETRGRGFSIPYGVLTASLLFLVWSLVPAGLKEWAPAPMDTMQPIDAISMVVIATVFAAAIWMVVYLVRRDSTPQPETVADHIFKKFGQVFDSYARILGLIGIFAVGVIYSLSSNFAEVVGQLGNVLAIEPFLSSNILTVLAGFAALGGELPLIGSLPVLQDLSPMGWLVLVIILILVAGMAAYDARGQTSRLIR